MYIRARFTTVYAYMSNYSGMYVELVYMLRKASVARVDRRLRRYYLIVRLLPYVFALACLSLGSI